LTSSKHIRNCKLGCLRAISQAPLIALGLYWMGSFWVYNYYSQHLQNVDFYQNWVCVNIFITSAFENYCEFWSLKSTNLIRWWYYAEIENRSIISTRKMYTDRHIMLYNAKNAWARVIWNRIGWTWIPK